MDAKLIGLKLFLDELGVSSDITTIHDRKRVQKAIYLGQAVGGVDMGYRFGWYVRGPYSPGLAKDYYTLDASGSTDTTGWRLQDGALARLRSIRDLFAMPPQLTSKLTFEQWLELVASWHYLRNVSKLDKHGALATMTKEKAKLAPFVSYAENALSSHQS